MVNQVSYVTCTIPQKAKARSVDPSFHLNTHTLHADIAEYVGAWFAKGMTSINLEAMEVGLMGASGGMAYEWGYSTLSNKDGTMRIPSK